LLAKVLERKQLGIWEAGPVCVSVGLMPFVVTALFVQRWGTFCGTAVACTLYYWAYEYGHGCAHLAEAKPEECWRMFRCLNGHHALHHRCVERKSLVALPVADSLPEIPRLRLELPLSNPRQCSVPNGKRSRRKFNHARQL